MADSGHPISIISIHALRKESDTYIQLMNFPICISIHALRKESDKVGLLVVRVSGNFNPRSP